MFSEFYESQYKACQVIRGVQVPDGTGLVKLSEEFKTDEEFKKDV
jgi:hypothetical protein